MMRSARIFGLGFLALVIVFTLEAHPAIAAMAIAGAVLGTVLVGWVIRPQAQFLHTFIGNQDETCPDLYYDGQMIGERYPQVLVFRVDVRNLWLLGVPTVIAMSFLVWAAMKGPVNAINEAWANVSLLYWTSFAAVPIFMSTYAWIRERWLLFRGMVVLGIVADENPYLGNRSILRYEFLAPDGDRYGGLYHWKLWSLRSNGNVTPILLDRRDFNRHLPAVGLIFHKLVLVHRQHFPESRKEMLETQSPE